MSRNPWIDDELAALVLCPSCDIVHSVPSIIAARQELAIERKDHGFTKEALEDAHTRIASLFEAVKHGDAKHEAWLKEAIAAHFGPFNQRKFGKTKDHIHSLCALVATMAVQSREPKNSLYEELAEALKPVVDPNTDHCSWCGTSFPIDGSHRCGMQDDDAPYDFCSDCGARYTGHHACEGRPT